MIESQVRLISEGLKPILGGNYKKIDFSDDADTLSIFMLGEYCLDLRPMHPADGAQYVYDDSKYMQDVPYEYWKAEVEKQQLKYEEAVERIATKFPEFAVKIGYSFTGPDLSCRLNVPERIRMELKSAN